MSKVKNHGGSAGHFWPQQNVKELLEAKLGDQNLSTELQQAWSSPSIGITTVGEFVEVCPSDEMLKNVLGVNSLLGRSRLLRCVREPMLRMASVGAGRAA